MKKKYLLIIAIILMAISIAFIPPLVYSIVEMELATSHYWITEKVDGLQRYYGCGDYNCKYCLGKDNATSIYDSFIYLQIINNLFFSSVVIVPVFAFAAIIMFIIFGLINKKSKKTTNIFPTSPQNKNADHEYAKLIPEKIISFTKCACEKSDCKYLKNETQTIDMTIFIAFIYRIELLSGKTKEYAENFDLIYWSTLSDCFANKFNIDIGKINSILDDRLPYYESVIQSKDKDEQLLTYLTQFLIYDNDNPLSLWNKLYVVNGILSDIEFRACICDIAKGIKHDLALYRMSIMFSN